MAERLIDAEALRKEMQEYVLPITTNNLMGAADAYYRILHLLEDAPTIEAKPVVHAHWEGSRCSNCKRNLFELFDAGSHLIKDFEEEVVACPYCGAQMDEVVE